MSDTVKLVECTECLGKGFIERDGGGGNVRKCWCEKCEGWGLTKEYVDGVLTDLEIEKVDEDTQNTTTNVANRTKEKP